MNAADEIRSFYIGLGATLLRHSPVSENDDLTYIEYELPAGQIPSPVSSEYCAIHLVLAGQSRLRRLVGSGWEESVTSPGTLTLSPSAHWTRAAWSQTQRRFSVYFSNGRLHALAGLGAARRKNLTLHGDIVAHDAALGFTMRALHAQSLTPASGQQLAIDSLLSAVAAAWVCRHSSQRSDHDTAARGGLAAWQLKRLIEKLTDDIDQDVSLNGLAGLVGLSSSHLCTAFRQSTGLPPHQWQKRLRIERAKALLSAPKLSVTEVSLAIGYANPGHFATVFRRATGMTPREWRRTMQQ